MSQPPDRDAIEIAIKWCEPERARADVTPWIGTLLNLARWYLSQPEANAQPAPIDYKGLANEVLNTKSTGDISADLLAQPAPATEGRAAATRHVCGLQGFGKALDDVCPACRDAIGGPREGEK